MSPNWRGSASILRTLTCSVFHVKHGARVPRARTPHIRRGPLLVILLLTVALLGTACERLAAPEGWAAPVQAGSEYYAQLQRGTLTAFHLQGTNVKSDWQYPPAGGKLKFDAIYATPLIRDGIIYLASHDGHVIALDATSGKPATGWNATPTDLKQNIVSTPVLIDGHLLVAAEGGDLFSFDVTTGQYTRVLKGNGRIWSGLAAAGNTVYLGNLDSRRVRAVNVTSGAVEWEQSIAGASIANLVLDNQLLLVGSLDRALHALDVTANGQQRWKFAGDGWFAAQPAATADAIYAATLKGTVYALDPTTGTERWHFHQDGQEFRSRPVLVDNTLVIVSRNGVVYGLNAADGSEAWHHALPGQHVDADPLVSGSDVFIITNSGQLERVAAATGAIQTLGTAS